MFKLLDSLLPVNTRLFRRAAHSHTPLLCLPRLLGLWLSARLPRSDALTLCRSSHFLEGHYYRRATNGAGCGLRETWIQIFSLRLTAKCPWASLGFLICKMGIKNSPCALSAYFED